ncbi:MAG: proline--tRNA ligase [Candidatus Abawacabacteria bacterium]|nr:proline--tRNA ligase [Candidatus Abawacabacteria bacterium]
MNKKQLLTPQSQDFSQWYLDIVQHAELADYSSVKGCMIIKPYGYRIWELIQADLDRRIKARGVQNAYFPLFIPESFLRKEAEHVEGFAPEVAVVTHAGGKKLDEALVIRPTSETIIYDTYAKWIESYRDLPLLINQWANVVRWEMRTRPFLRTTEFLWQEGHTVHATKEEADTETLAALTMYQDFARDMLALPVLAGYKSEKEKFSGALYTMGVESLAKDGKSIQFGTSHNLGQNFAKAFNISFSDTDGQRKTPWQTSWGVSTRMIGALIVSHGDDDGLKLPPPVAPIQIVMIPIAREAADAKKIIEQLNQFKQDLTPVRVHIDSRDGVSIGFKRNEWEMKGVPLRLEMGMQELAQNIVSIARRDTGEKLAIPLDQVSSALPKLLDQITTDMYQAAKTYVESAITEVHNKEDFDRVIEKGGYAKAYFCEDPAMEKEIQEKTKATTRVVVMGDTKPGTCFYSGKPAERQWYFAKAY